MFTWLPLRPSQGSWPCVNISQRVTPNIHVSVAWENVLVFRLSGAHLQQDRQQTCTKCTYPQVILTLGRELVFQCGYSNFKSIKSCTVFRNLNFMYMNENSRKKDGLLASCLANTEFGKETQKNKHCFIISIRIAGMQL